MLVAVMLVMVVVAAPVAHAEWPYSALCQEEVDRIGGHAPGEFIVTYDSMEAMWAASQENVKHTFEHWGWYDTETGPVYYPIPYEMQTLYFEDLASIPDVEERLAAEEAKRQEILTWPGVKYAEYNGIGCVQ